MIRVLINRSGAFWATSDIVGGFVDRAAYEASPLIIVLPGFIVDLRDQITTPLPYETIAGLTISEIRVLLGDDDEPAPLLVTVVGDRSYIVSGSPLAETIVANGGSDLLTDGQSAGPAPNGVDLLYGGSGGDLYVLESSASQALEYRVAPDGTITAEDAGGVDTVSVRAGDYTLAPFVEGLFLGSGRVGTGNAADNGILGNRASNILSGLGGDDQLLGFSGEDTLDGGTGADIVSGDWGGDTLTGGADGDLFFFDPGRRGRDTITDLDPEDVIVVLRPVRDSDGDGIVTFADNGVLDLARRASVAITAADDSAVTTLEHDGSYEQNGVTLYVYSLVGTPAGVATARAFDLKGVLVNL